MMLNHLPAVRVIAFCLPLVCLPVWASAQLRVIPRDASSETQLAQALSAAVARVDGGEVARLATAALDTYPNNPGVRAALQDLAGAGRELGPVTRGQKNSRLEKLAAALGVVSATLTAVTDSRDQLRQQRQMREGAQRPAPPMGDMSGGMFPGMAVGMGGYQPPQVPQAPMPGYGYPQNAPAPQTPAAPYPYPYPPQPQAAYPGGAVPQDLYRAPVGYTGAPIVRGRAIDPLQAVLDLADASADGYFATSCNVLLNVDGRALTVTPGCAVAPRVIPITEIVDVVPAASSASAVGAFQVRTSRGLVLQLAAPAGTPAAGEALRSTLQSLIGGRR